MQQLTINLRSVPACLLVAILLAGCASRYESTYQIGSSSTVSASQASAVMADRIATESRDPTGQLLDTPLRVLAGKPPAMPLEAIRKGVQGTVKVRIAFNERGTVRNIDVLSSPNELLSTAAMDAVGGWQVEPRLVAGVPTGFDAVQTFHFKLK